MKELQNILSAFGKVRAEEKSAVLATVVKTSGSTYRRPGARLLITQYGQMIGSVSGGCLERDVFRQAKRVMQTKEPMLVRYDSMSEEDIVWGFGLDCNGIVDVLIEPLPGGRERSQMDFLEACLRLRQAGVLATVFAAEGAVWGWNLEVGQCSGRESLLRATLRISRSKKRFSKMLGKC